MTWQEGAQALSAGGPFGEATLPVEPLRAGGTKTGSEGKVQAQERGRSLLCPWPEEDRAVHVVTPWLCGLGHLACLRGSLFKCDARNRSPTVF